MNQRDTNLQFKKSTTNANNKPVNSQNRRDIARAKIMDKFGVSLEEAEKILLNLEKSNNEIPRNGVSRKSIAVKDNSQRDTRLKQNYKGNNGVNTISHQGNEKDLDNNAETLKEKNLNNSSPKNKVNENLDFNLASDLKRQKNDFNQVELGKEPTSHNKSPEMRNVENIDSLLEDIVVDYDKKISIKVEHVDLTFEVQNEKIDTLKEAVIRTLKREKSNKIKIHALNDVSFEIYKGEKVGVIGYNGAGKSTLLGAITGIYAPDNGKITTYGKISPLLSLGAGFDHNFSGRKNIMLNGAVLGYDKSFLESKVDEIIEFSELGEFIDIPIKNYSSGMLAKLGFSIATIVEPDILIIDEVLGVGDVTFQKKCRDKIMSLMDGGTTVILVSHAIPQIRQLCDKAIWIDKGCLRDMGEVNKICDEYLKDAEMATKEQLANIQFK